MPPLLLALLIIMGGLVYCQSPRECQMAEKAFNETIACMVTYGDIGSERGCELGRASVLCEGECGDLARGISCRCGDGNQNPIVNNIGQLCNCESNITCPEPISRPCSRAARLVDTITAINNPVEPIFHFIPEPGIGSVQLIAVVDVKINCIYATVDYCVQTNNCSKAVYRFNKECGIAYSTLITNNSCSTCCTTLCDSPQCNKLAKNISCYCSEMSEGYQIITNMNSFCKCSVEHCNSSATDLLPSPWILMLLTVSIATQWILGWISY